LGEKYVDQEYYRLQALIAVHLHGEQVTLVPDGSTDGCQESITHIMAVDSHNIPSLCKVIIHTTEEHTAQNLVAEVVEIVSHMRTYPFFAILEILCIVFS